jgi:hypothetical protein
MDTIGSGSAGQASADRVAVFIDGFNVYWGLRDKGFKRFYWLDYQALASHLVRDGQVLVATKFFTTRGEIVNTCGWDSGDLPFNSCSRDHLPRLVS